MVLSSVIIDSNAVQYSAVLFSTVLYSAVLYCADYAVLCGSIYFPFLRERGLNGWEIKVSKQNKMVEEKTNT
jgi:hypothetical protein